jgi:hypothetical protein
VGHDVAHEWKVNVLLSNVLIPELALLPSPHLVSDD